MNFYLPFNLKIFFDFFSSSVYFIDYGPMSNVLILLGSPRKHGNTARLAAEFAHGARESGHTVTEIALKEKTIGDCIACGACQHNGGQCVQKDDMQEIYACLQKNDIIVLASPVYFYTWTSLTKRMIDRTYAAVSTLQNKTFYLISTGAATEESYMKTMLDSFQLYISCFRAGGNKIGSCLFGCGTNAQDDVVKLPVMEKAYKLGKSPQ